MGRRAVPILLDTPAAVRWLSMEPLLGPVDLWNCGGVSAIARDWAGGPGGGTGAPHPLVDWVVVGGESGPSARPMHPDWVRRIRDVCANEDVSFFFKQWGEWQDGASGVIERDHVIVADGRHEQWYGHTKDGGQPATPLALARCRNELLTDRAVVISRVGKKAAGRLLDGALHDAYPVAVA